MIPLRRSFSRIVLATCLVCGALGPTAAHAESDASAPTLRELAEQRGVAVGAAMEVPDLAYPKFTETLNREYSQVTPGNDLKWDATEPERGQFDFSRADRAVNTAKKNNQSIHGHTLVWYNQTPGWVSELDEAELRKATKNHIARVVGRYKGQIESWDVVNEPFNDDGTRRDNAWQQKMGDGYIAEALRWAHAADPDAKLYVNDYNVEGIGAKSDAMYELVRSLKQQGVPIHGVGFQGHFIVGGIPDSLRENIQRFVDLGLDVKITELDVRIELPADQAELQQQAKDYRTVAESCLAIKGCRGVTTWGISDARSWIPDVFPGYGAALPFNGNYQPKPAYDALHAAYGG